MNGSHVPGDRTGPGEEGQWHKLFETRHADGHQGFLEWLGLPPKEIDRIRQQQIIGTRDWWRPARRHHFGYLAG